MAGIFGSQYNDTKVMVNDLDNLSQMNTAAKASSEGVMKPPKGEDMDAGSWWAWLSGYTRQKTQENVARVQEELASFREQYRGNLSVRSQTEEQRLESEYQVAFGLYNTLMQQREQAKLKVQEQTPVFKILEPVQVPHNDEKSGFTILFVFTFLSGLLSLFHILYTKKIINIKNKITK